MTTDNYTKPTFGEISQQRDAVSFFTRHEIQNLEKALDLLWQRRKKNWVFPSPRNRLTS